MTPGPAPEHTHPSGDNRFKLLDRTISRFQGRGDALIEVLHSAQSIFGYLENDLMIYVARALKLPLSRVYGVATFYHFFNLKPKGTHTFVLCMGTACYVKGAEAIQDAVSAACGIRFGETTTDNAVSLVTARCIGSCGLAPVAVADDQVAGKLNATAAVERVQTWIKEPEQVST